MALSPIFLTGFEQGVLSASGTGLWNVITGAGFAIASDTPRSGTYYAQLTAPATTAEKLSLTIPGGARTNLVGRVAFRVDSLPASGTTNTIVFAGTTATSTAGFYLALGNDNKIYARIGSGTIRSSAALSAGWHVLEWQAQWAANPETMDWRIDGVSQTQCTYASTTTISYFGLGNPATTGVAYTASYDDLIIGDWSTAATDWFGDGTILPQSPGSDGTHTFTSTHASHGASGSSYITGATTDAYLLVDDVPFGTAYDGTDCIGQRVIAAEYAEIAPTTTARTGTPNAVRASMAYSSSTTTTNSAACTILNGDAVETTLWGNSGAVADYSESSNFFKTALVPAPAAGWSAAAINALRWRFGWAADISPVPTVQALMLEVDWPPLPRDWYVSPVGSGTTGTVGAPVTLDYANSVANPGDTIYLMTGEYDTTTGFSFARNGSASLPITYTNYGGVATFKYTGSALDWGIFTLATGTPWAGSSYISIVGTDVGAAKGIVFDGQNQISIGIDVRQGSHHVIVQGCRIINCSATGIAFNASDYCQALDNQVWHCGYLQGWSSGISLWYSGATPIYGGATAAYDSYTGFHNVIARNVIAGCYDGSSNHSDGNGIIVDGGSTSLPPALIIGNVCYHNGGWGIVVGNTSGDVWIVNNTCYENGLDTTLTDGEAGELSCTSGIAASTSVHYINNIVYTRKGATSGGTTVTNMHTNPSVENGTTGFNKTTGGWTSTAGTMVQSTTQALDDTHSLSFSGTGGQANDGFGFLLPFAVTAGHTYRFAVYAYNSSTGYNPPCGLFLGISGGDSATQAFPSGIADAWEAWGAQIWTRLEMSWTAASSHSANTCWAGFRWTGTGEQTVYFDEFMVWEGDAAWPWGDGDWPNNSWVGTPDASASVIVNQVYEQGYTALGDTPTTPQSVTNLGYNGVTIGAHPAAFAIATDPSFTSPPALPSGSTPWASALDPASLSLGLTLTSSGPAYRAGTDPSTVTGMTGNLLTDLGTHITTDVNGNPRFSGSLIDIGAYEYTVIPAPLTAALAGTGSLTPGLTTASLMTATLGGVGTQSGIQLKRLEATNAGAGTLTGGLTVASLMTVTLAGTGTASGALLKRLEATLAGTGTLTPTLSAATAMSASLAGTGTLTGTPLKRMEASLAGTGALGGSFGAVSEMTASLAGVGALSGAPLKRMAATAGGVGSIVATLIAGANPAQLTSTLGSAGTLSSGLLKRMEATAAGVGMVTASLVVARQMTANLAGAGTLTPRLTAAPHMSVGLVSTGGLAGALLKRMEATLSGVGQISPRLMVPGPAWVTVTLASTGTMAGSLARLMNASLAGAGGLTGSLRKRFVATLSGVGLTTPKLTAPSRMTARLDGASTVTGALLKRLAASLGGAGTVTANPRATSLMSANLGGTGTLTGAPLRRLQGTLVGSSAITPKLRAPSKMAASLGGAGTLGGTPLKRLAGSLGGAGTVTASLKAVPLMSATLAGMGTLGATPLKRLESTLAGTGTIAPGLTASPRMAANLGGTSTLTGALRKRFVAVLSSTGAITGFLRASSRLRGSLGATGTVSGAPLKRIEARLGGTGQISATLNTVPALTSQLTGTGTVAGWLCVGAQMTGALFGAGMQTAHLTASANMHASLFGAGTLSAKVHAPASMTAALGGAGTTAGKLTAGGRMASLLTGTGTLSGTIVTAPHLLASLSGAGATSSTLTAASQVSAVVSSTGSLTVRLAVGSQMTVTIDGHGTTSANLTAASRLTATFSGIGTLTATATTLPKLHGTLAGVGGTSGQLIVARRMSATVAGIGTIRATLFAGGPSEERLLDVGLASNTTRVLFAQTETTALLVSPQTGVGSFG